MTPRDGWFRFTDTGIPATDRKSLEILESVIGQLSDGIWENSPGMGKYWKNLHIDTRDGNIIINETYNSPFRWDDQKKVLEFFANKVKQIIKTEIEDGRSDLEWKRDCTGISDYLGYKEQITVRDAYKVYDQLKGRKPRIKESKKLTEANEFKSLKVKVYMEHLNYRNEVNDRTLIAAFRTKNWADKFVSLAEEWCKDFPSNRIVVEVE